MLDMMTSTRAYEANATAFQATKAMSTKLLELIR
jgi:flagellar basal body rod protein FlgC